VGSIEVAPLVRSALDGDSEAWDELVRRFAGLVWSVARAHGLEPADAADVSQTTWLRLAENLPRLRDPERVGAWLATTAKREALRVLRRGQRQIPSGVDFGGDIECEDGHPETPVLRRERDAALTAAFRTLPAMCRTLLRVLLSDPAPSYAEVSETLDMPVGSIGPRRARCLDRLRVVVERTGDDPAADGRREPVEAVG
jgi:RNA polymerase sigma factor (sigma-70 family)